jgi:hypothetical protein
MHTQFGKLATGASDRLPPQHVSPALNGHGLASSEFQSTPNDADFVALQAAFRASNGLARGQDLAHSMGHRQGGYVSLARMIVTRQVFSFAWHDDFWLPMFQIDMAHARVKPQPQAVVGELVDVMDGWALAVWFAKGNCALSDQSPIAMLETDPRAVFDAARLQRFAMTG